MLMSPSVGQKAIVVWSRSGEHSASAIKPESIEIARYLDSTTGKEYPRPDSVGYGLESAGLGRGERFASLA
jgi:hypothetical protein